MAPRPPSLRAVAAFEAAARHQSFAKAAEELNLSNGAISHAIRALEERLGTPLFERQGRGVIVTEAGRVFAGRVRLSLGLLDQAFETRPWLDRSRLVVTTHPSFAMRILAPRLADFQVSCPDIELELRASASLDPIGQRDIDVGIRYGPGSWAGLNAVRLFGETLFPVVAPAFMRRPPERPEDLANHPLLTHPEFPWRPWFTAAGLDWDEPRGVMQTDESGLLLDIAAGGVGIALARSGLAAPDLQSGRLLRLFDIEISANYAYWLVWSPTSPKLEAIELFLAWLRDVLPRN